LGHFPAHQFVHNKQKKADMASVKDVTNVWKNIREVDLRPIRDAALQPLKVAIVGAPGSGRRTLAGQMRIDPSRPAMQTQTPLLITDLDGAERGAGADLFILMIDVTSTDASREQALARAWVDAGRRVVVFLNKVDLFAGGGVLENWSTWQAYNVVYASANDSQSLLKNFVPAVLELLAELLMPLARQFPLFRAPVARQMINETSFSNAGYSLTTGLAGVVPALIVPMNISDMLVLSKAQAFLVYKLGLAFGFSTEWRDYLAEFGSIIGSGFMWRQLARQLVGLIPVWGIVPKVGVAYAGTYVVGHAVLRWYLTGKHVTPQQMREFYLQAFEKGKGVGRKLLQKRPRPRLFRRRQALLNPPAGMKNCPSCGKPNAEDAIFCQYCGKSLSPGE
jgi:uncharacterized protein (DUF697 family)